MADNILKKELLLEEQQKKAKKKLYKSWKPYASILAIIIIGGSIATGIYYVRGHKNHNGDTTIPITPINLNTLNQTAILGKENMIQADAFKAFINNNKEKHPDLESNVEISSFTASSYTLNGELIVKTRTNSSKYIGNVTVTITELGQTKLSDLTDIVKEVGNTTTKDNALQVFLDANKNKYPDLISYVTFNENSFTAPSYTSTGSYTINATTNGKYSGNIEIIITAKNKIELSSVITTTEIEGKIDQNQVIETTLKANSNSGVTANDLKIINFNAPTVTFAGSATIEAIDSSKFIGSVNITITLFPKDAELTRIINKIKNTPSKTLAAIEVWKEYFAYYSQEKIQYMVNTINTKYTVNKTDSTDVKKSKLIAQIRINISELLHQVIAGKDGLAYIRYDDFNINTTANNFDEINNIITIKVSLNFIWNVQNDIKTVTNLKEERTVDIKFSIV